MIYPWLIYDAIMVVMSMLFAAPFLLFGAYDAATRSALWATGVSGLIMIPIALFFLRRDEQRRAPLANVGGGMRLTGVLWMLALGSSLSYAVNLLLNMLHVFELFPHYSENTAEAVMSGSFWVSLIVSALIAPVTEELLMRGLVYQRLRDYLGARMGILLSALIFGIFHGNVVQFIYAFLLGLALAWAMEYFQTLLAPILLHFSANLWSLLLSYYGRALAGIAGGFLLGGIIMIQFLVIIFSGLYILKRKKEHRIV